MTVSAPPRPNDPIEFQELEPEADADALIEEARQRARRRRRMYGSVVAVVALVGVAVTVFGHTAQSHPTAATRPSGAGPSAAFQPNVRIDLTGTMLPARGEFTISGAISDRGTFVDDGSFHTVRTLLGGNGTIRITVGPQGRWEIIEGTKAYAGLHGRGSEAGLYSTTIDITMSGTVSQF
jgi:hypothetical protein